MTVDESDSENNMAVNNDMLQEKLDDISEDGWIHLLLPLL